MWLVLLGKKSRGKVMCFFWKVNCALCIIWNKMYFRFINIILTIQVNAVIYIISSISFTACPSVRHYWNWLCWGCRLHDKTSYKKSWSMVRKREVSLSLLKSEQRIKRPLPAKWPYEMSLITRSCIFRSRFSWYNYGMIYVNRYCFRS